MHEPALQVSPQRRCRLKSGLVQDAIDGAVKQRIRLKTLNDAVFSVDASARDKVWKTAQYLRKNECIVETKLSE